MAITDLLPDAVRSYFYPDVTTTVPPVTGSVPSPSWQSLENRRKIVAAMMGRRRSAAPKNVGEGINAVGEGLADAAEMRALEQRERAYDAQYQRNTGPTSATPQAPTTAPAATPASATPQASPAAAAYSAGDGGAADAADAAEEDNPVLRAVADYRGAEDPYNPRPAPGVPGPPQWPSGTRLVEYNGPPAAPGSFGRSPGDDDGRDAIATAMMTNAGGGVPYPNPIMAGATAPATATATEPVAALSPRDNPPIVRTDITPRPVQMAQAMTPTPVGGRPLSSSPSPKQIDEPAAPQMDTRPTPEEIRAMDLVRRYPGDPNYALFAKQLSDQGAARRRADYEQRKAQYEQRSALFKSEFDNRYAREEAERLREFAAEHGITNDEAKAVMTDYSTKRRPVAETVAAGQDAIRQARTALMQGAITGIGSEARINWGRLMSLIGQPDRGSDAANSQAFGILMQPVTNAQRAASVGNAQISNADILMSKMAAGADVNLEPKAIFHVLNVLEENGQKHLQDYQARTERLFHTDKNPAREAIYGVPAYDRAPQRFPAPAGGRPARVYTPTDARRFPTGTPLILSDGSEGTAP